MRGWPLYLGIVGGAVALAFVLKSLPPGIVIVVALIAVAVASVRYRRLARPRNEGVAALGLGFARSSTDPFSLRSLPLALFLRGADQQISDVMWGNWGDVEVKVFSLGYSDASGVRRAFTCALAPSPTEGLVLVAEPRTFLIPEAERAPSPVVAIDDETFAAEFDVRSDDARRSAELLDEGLRGRLRSLQDRWAFELRDRMLLCYSPVQGMEPIEALGTLTMLRRALAGAPVPAPLDDPGSAGQSGTAEA